MTEPVQPIALSFPFRRGFMGQVVIPRDMSRMEAARLCEFVRALAMPDAALIGLPVIDPDLLDTSKEAGK